MPISPEDEFGEEENCNYVNMEISVKKTEK